MNDPKKEDRAPKPDSADKADWSHDIENREYYYDDATGYEVYDPDREEEDEEAPESADLKNTTDK